MPNPLDPGTPGRAFPEAASANARRSRRRLWYAVLAAVIAGAVTVAAVRWTGHHAATDEPAPKAVAVQTVTVERMDLSSGYPLEGSIGYGAARSLKAVGGGVLTWLPPAGSIVRRGGAMYRVDDKPVPLFYGVIPLFRTLDRPLLVGRDVRVVADNLVALGYRIGRQPEPGTVITQTTSRPATPDPATTNPTTTDPGAAPDPKAAVGSPTVPRTKLGTTATPEAKAKAKPMPGATSVRVKVRAGEGVLTERLVRAIKDWQRDLGRPVSGQIERGDVVVQPGPLRVAAVPVQVGDDAEGELMSVTPTAKVITVQADAGEASSVNRGDRVTVTLPDGGKAPADVVAVGTALKAEGEDQNGPPKLAVTVMLDDPRKAGRIDAAAVQVEFVAETHKGVLTVPVGALLALRGGGYAVQVSGGPLIGVRTGIFSRGTVEVSGKGLAEGTKVVTTS